MLLQSISKFSAIDSFQLIFNRKILAIGLLSIAALVASELPSMARPATIDPAQRAGVKVRSGPSIQTTALDGLPGGTPIEVLNITNDANTSRSYWYYVRSTGRYKTEGWVASELIRFNPSRQIYGTLVGDLGDRINIRSAPNIDEAIRHTGIPGDLVTLGQSTLGEDGDRWHSVTYPNGSSGWVRAELISVHLPRLIITDR